MTTSTATLHPALDLRTLFAPRSVAVIGASSDATRHNGRPIANLLRTGYSGRIHPITARPGDVQGLPSHRSILDVAEPVDLAYILVRAEFAEALVDECVQAGVRTIVVCSSGFAEEGGEGRAVQERLRDRARAGGSRVIGPNCIGVVGVQDAALSCTTLNITDELLPGGLAIVSQSGGMAVNIYNRAVGRGIGVRGLVSLGNEADVDLADVVGALAQDVDTRTIALFVEQLRDVPRFLEAVRSARENGKTVIALKSGRSAAGARSAASHTGAMAGSYDVFRAAMRRAGVVVVDSIDDILDTATLVESWPPLRGVRTLVISPSGGECGYAADAAATAGLETPEMSDGLRERLAVIMRFGTPANPLDLTGQVIGDSQLLTRVFDAISEFDEYDAALVALPTWGASDSAILVPPIIDAAQRSSLPMAIAAWSSRGLTEFRDAQLRDSPVVTFDDPARALRAFAFASEAATAEASSPPPAGDPFDIPAAAFLDEAAAKAFLATRGLPVSVERSVPTAAEAVEAAAALGWPVVVKGLASGIAHKSEYGLVRTGLRDTAAVDGAIRAIDESVARNGLALEGYLVAKQYTGVEMIAGCVSDSTFGATLLVGAGGVLAEVLDDSVVIPCPASADDVRTALSRLRIWRVLTGFRGVSHDAEALCATLARFSMLASNAANLAEADLNPIIVGPDGDGCVVVDAFLRETPNPGGV